MKYKLLLFFCIISTMNITVSCSKMLILMPGGTRSHYIFYSSVARALSEAGHQVSIVSPFSGNLNQNVKQVKLDVNFFDVVFQNAFGDNIVTMTVNYVNEYVRLCPQVYNDKKVQDLLAEEFDLILVAYGTADCFFYYIHQKQVPFILMMANEIYGPLANDVGNLMLYSIFPNVFVPLIYPMSFSQRLTSTLYSGFESIILEYQMRSMAEECRKHGITSSEDPSLRTIMRNASLAMVNSVVTVDYPARVYSPTVIFAGGIHINPEGKLKQEDSDWLEGSGEDGFILFSLGSSVPPSDMKPEHKNIIINVFKSLKQRVLWKWNLPDMADLPENVRISRWIPQQDILAHPKLRLFITHGGLLSIQEATYFKVPVVGLPVFGDQFSNLMKAEAEGWGTWLRWDDLSEESLSKAINGVLTNSSYRKNVARRSSLMRDTRLTPSEEVVFWSEYVIRHKGAAHLKSPIGAMPWYQLINVDVWIFLIFVVLLEMVLGILFILYLVNKCRTQKISKSKND